jgi:hypothetical protein
VPVVFDLAEHRMIDPMQRGRVRVIPGVEITRGRVDCVARESREI